MLDRAATRPRTVLAAGGFDELYFFYFEDLVAPGWRLAQRRLPVVVGQRRYQILVPREPTETRPVVDQSIVAPVHGRHDDGDHLALGAGER